MTERRDLRNFVLEQLANIADALLDIIGRLWYTVRHPALGTLHRQRNPAARRPVLSAMAQNQLWRCSLVLSLGTLSVLSLGQADPHTCRPMKACECTMAPVIDGDLTEPCWASCAGIAETFVDRTTGDVVQDQTIAKMMYDAKYIYISFHCKDSEPEKVLARETVRDHKYASQSDDNPNKEDNVTFTIDPYFTKKSGDLSVFSVNALGTPSAKIAGGRGGKLEWKGNWESAAKRVADGYTVEIRIPWEMLNYPSSKEPCTMGINFYRYQYRNKLESLWSNVGMHSFTDLEGVWTDVQVPKSAFKPKLSLLPYVLPGIEEDRLTFRSGLDARLTITPDLTGVASLNPDFNTIEGAIEGIAFSRVERFIPEKRPFFLEGQDYFQPGTRFNDIGAYFYARRIDTFDLGTKVYGKISPTDSVGFLNTVTFGERMDTVLRYKHDLSDTSDAGFFVGQRSSSGGNNTVAMVDQHARFGGIGFESQFARTWGENANGGAVVLSTNYQGGNNASVLQYHTISEEFQIADGFIPYTGYHGFFGFTDFNSQWRTGPWQSYDYGVYGIAWEHQDGSRYQQGFGTFGSLIHRDDYRVSFSQDYGIVDGTVDSTFMVGGVIGNSNRFRKYGVNITTGRLASMPATFISGSASLRLFKGLDLGYSGSVLNLDGSTNQHTVTLGYEISPTKSFGGRLVAQDSDTNWYLSYRNSGGRGTNFYVIVGDPNSRTFKRVLQFKLVFAL